MAWFTHARTHARTHAFFIALTLVAAALVAGCGGDSASGPASAAEAGNGSGATGGAGGAEVGPGCSTADDSCLLDAIQIIEPSGATRVTATIPEPAADTAGAVPSIDSSNTGSLTIENGNTAEITINWTDPTGATPGLVIRPMVTAGTFFCGAIPCGHFDVPPELDGLTTGSTTIQIRIEGVDAGKFDLAIAPFARLDAEGVYVGLGDQFRVDVSVLGESSSPPVDLPPEGGSGGTGDTPSASCRRGCDSSRDSCNSTYARCLSSLDSCVGVCSSSFVSCRASSASYASCLDSEDICRRGCQSSFDSAADCGCHDQCCYDSYNSCISGCP